MNYLDNNIITYIKNSIDNRKGVFIYSDPENDILVSNNE
jgi:hypothetical protein